MENSIDVISADQAAHNGHRRRLGTQRWGHTREVNHGGLQLQLTINFFSDGRPAEIFIHSAATGSDLGGMLHALAVTASLAMQYGVPWEKIHEKWRGMRFGCIQTKQALSVIDALALAMEKTCRFVQERA